ncbi:MAG TPA: nickel insertion protein, partial [Planctomycetota bacterium]
LFEKLFAAGAVDVYTTPVQMKKSRPGVKVSVLTPPDRRRAVEEVLLRETPTFGVRRVLMERTKLDRRMVEVDTPYGPIPVKEGLREGALLKAAPEYEAARKAAERHGVPLSRVLKAATDVHSKRHNHK